MSPRNPKRKSGWFIMRHGVRHPVDLLLALAVLFQGIGLIYLGHLGLRASTQCLMIALALAIATHEVWRNRQRLDHHVDMLVVMLAFGGLGMLAGTGIDLALARTTHGNTRISTSINGSTQAASTAEPACCSTMNSGNGQNTGRPNIGNNIEKNIAVPEGYARMGSFLLGIYRSLLSWMTGLMLLGGILPALFLTRCATLAGASWRRWIATHLAGNLGMVVGMIAAGKLFGHVLGLRIGSPVVGHHLTMVAGMLTGMTSAQFLAEAALGLRPWRSITAPEQIHSASPEIPRHSASTLP